MTALLAALLGEEVINREYKRGRITIAFHPGEARFEVANPAIRRDRAWIPDIITVFVPDVRMRQIVDEYCDANPDADKYVIDERMEGLRAIRNNSLGLIDLNADLEVEEVADIFVRINSQGVALSAADFAMSKMAANEEFDGHRLRKCIDYFCHLAVAPEAYSDLSKDEDFVETDYFHRMEWLKNERDDLYDPSYTDLLRVAFTSEFKRGRLEDLVALLSGRNFESRRFEEEIAEASFSRLREGVLRFINQTNFQRFIMVLRSAGFVDKGLIRSQNTVNFAYILYLTLRGQGMASAEIERVVRRWFVMSVLTGRYTGSPETTFGVDVRGVDTQGAAQYIDTLERAELSDAFWDVGLPQQMDTPVASSPYFNVYLASQVKGNDKGFLSRDLTVRDLIEGEWHIHHVFPRSYLQKNGLPRSRYNQIANYVPMQGEINIAIGDRAPQRYFSDLREQCSTGVPRYGGITDSRTLEDNLTSHCIPAEMHQLDVEDYNEFLQKRRQLMSAKIRDYYADQAIRFPVGAMFSEPDCSPHPFDILAMHALYRAVPKVTIGGDLEGISGGTISLMGMASGGSRPYSYQWIDPTQDFVYSPNAESGSVTITLPTLAPGVNTVVRHLNLTITDSKGAKASRDVEVPVSSDFGLVTVHCVSTH